MQPVNPKPIMTAKLESMDGFPIPNGERSNWDFSLGVTLAVDLGHTDCTSISLTSHNKILKLSRTMKYVDYLSSHWKDKLNPDLGSYL
jgi:hypothetical protein